MRELEGNLEDPLLIPRLMGYAFALVISWAGFDISTQLAGHFAGDYAYRYMPLIISFGVVVSNAILLAFVSWAGIRRA